MSTNRKAAKAKKVGGFKFGGGKSMETAWLHLNHHHLGHPLYIGEGVSEDGEMGYAKDAQPVRVRVRDVNAESMSKERRRLLRLATQSAQGRRPDADADDEILRGMLKFSIVEFDNLLHPDDTPLDASSDEDREEFLKMGDFADQLLNFMTDRANFFAKGSRDSRP